MHITNIYDYVHDVIKLDVCTEIIHFVDLEKTISTMINVISKFLVVYLLLRY
jgi:hypothetical protein